MRLRAALTAVVVALCACSNTAQVTRGEGLSVGAAQAVQTLPRIAVGGIIDKSGADGEQSLVRQIEQINARNGSAAPMQVSSLTRGVRDMLTTELFNTGKFTVLERDALKDVMLEQEFSQSAAVNQRTRIPLGQLEGAQYLVVGAITAFDAGLSGGAIPVPIPLSRNGDFGVLNISGKRGYVAMDLRVIDVKTGRVLSSTAVEGKNWRFGLDFGGFFRMGHGVIALPGLLKYFNNTPVEEALQKMVTAAVERITEQASPSH